MTRNEFDDWIYKTHGPCFPAVREWLLDLPKEMRDKTKDEWFEVLKIVGYNACCQASAIFS